MNSKTYLHKLESDKYLEFKTNEKTFYPTTTSNEFISEFKKFQKFEKKIVETLDLEYGVGIVGIVLNHLGLIQSPEIELTLNDLKLFLRSQHHILDQAFPQFFFRIFETF